MSFIAEFTITSPLLERTESAVPNMTLQAEDFYMFDESCSRYVFWASGDDFQRMEKALDRDETIEEFAVLADLQEQRLYRVNFSDRGEQILSYSDASRNDIVYLELRSSNNVTEIRTRVPSREALQRYRNACAEKNLDFQLQSLYQESEEIVDHGSINRFGLTHEQYETMLLAFERGYYNSEREVTLEDIAEELGISRQAVAGRLRRGLYQLLSNTILRQALA